MQVRLEEVSTTTERYSQAQADVDGTILGTRLGAYFARDEGREALYAAYSLHEDDGSVVVANLRHPFLDDTVSADALELYLRLLLVDAATLSRTSQPEATQRWIVLRDALMRSLSEGVD